MEEEKKKRGRPPKGTVVEKKEVVLRKYREPAPKRTNAPGAGPPKKSEEEKEFTKKTAGIRTRNRSLKRRILEAKKLLKRVGEVPEDRRRERLTPVTFVPADPRAASGTCASSARARRASFSNVSSSGRSAPRWRLRPDRKCST